MEVQQHRKKEEGVAAEEKIGAALYGVEGEGVPCVRDLKGIARHRPHQKIKTCGPLIFILPSSNSKLLEKGYFFTWHLSLRLGKTKDLSNDVCQTVGVAR